ncbi:MAG TPA: enoyl-CoA hydratase [Kiloniellaceae bacterium]|nr:enoyl-CoA hydratase [Kiloniellaceae bacterium]
MHEESATATSDAPAQDGPLRARREGAVALLTLNRPKAYNALSLELMAALQTELEAISVDPKVAVVVIEGAGRGFCAGHDLKELRANGGRAFLEETFDACSRLMMTFTALPQPVIAKVHGIATAAGCQLVATCDLAVAAEGTRFGTPGVNIGLFCSTPMVALSRAVPRKQAMEMLLTGETVDAARALQIGLINRVVPPADLDAATLALANSVAEKSHLVLKIGKEAFYRQIEKDLSGAYAYCSQVMVENMLARDAAEGIDAFIEKRKPLWENR